jgi:hypothetical protein
VVPNARLEASGSIVASLRRIFWEVIMAVRDVCMDGWIDVWQTLEWG